MTEQRQKVILLASCAVGLMAISCLWCLWGAFGPGIWLRWLPTPPGIIRDTEYIDSGTMLTFRWIRDYSANQPFTEVVDFFKEKMPRRGWRLIDERSIKTSSVDGKEDIFFVRLFFQGWLPWSRTIEIMAIASFEPGTLVQIGTTGVRIYADADKE
jgi:hypothetical protein